MSNTAIAAMVGVSRPTVIVWRNRYAQAGIAGLGDLARSGRPPVIDDLEVVVATLAVPPQHRFSTDPELDAKVRDVVGLYLKPPEKAVVVCVDENPSPGPGQDRTDPATATRAAREATHDYVRHGTTSLFAALEVATGKVTDACYGWHTRAEFLAVKRVESMAVVYDETPFERGVVT